VWINKIKILYIYIYIYIHTQYTKISINLFRSIYININIRVNPNPNNPALSLPRAARQSPPGAAPTYSHGEMGGCIHIDTHRSIYIYICLHTRMHPCECISIYIYISTYT